MSIKTALDNINLKPCPRWGHTEYSLEYQKEYLARRTGLHVDDPGLPAISSNNLCIDFWWRTNDGLIDWTKAGRTTNMGHASYASDGHDQKDSGTSPFQTMEEVWEFDAVKEYGLPDFTEQVRAYEQLVQTSRRDFPDRLTTGGVYKSLVSGAIESFGWDMLLLATSEPDKMERVFDSFFRRTLFMMKAWAETSVEVIIQHDDFVWTSGAFMNPEIYRKVIIPRYAELWKPLHAKGKKVIFCSDGNFMDFAGDVANAGADGFAFEPMMDFGRMADDFGKTKCLVGSFVDCRDLTFGTWDKVRSDIDRTFEKLEKCKGAILAVGNHLPSNITSEMLDKYFAELLPRLKK